MLVGGRLMLEVPLALPILREYFTRTTIVSLSWIVVLDLPSRTTISRSPESRTTIQDYDEIVFVVLIAVLIVVLIVVLDFRFS